MTTPARITPQMLQKCAEVAKESGVAVSLESGGRVYTFYPDAHAPNPVRDEDVEKCDEAFL